MNLPRLGRGVNLGGWLSQTSGGEEHRQRFITRDDFMRISGWGFTNVRIPFDYPLICPGESAKSLSEAGLAWLDLAIRWAKEADLQAILDMHRLPGFSFMDPVRSPGAVPPLFGTEEAPALFCDLWAALTRRYAGQFEHLAFELANEIVAPRAPQWNQLAARAVATIRKDDPHRTVVVGSNCWNVCSTYPELAALDDPEVVYNFHFYNPFPFTHQRAPWSPEMVYYDRSVTYPGRIPGLRKAGRKARAEGKAWVGDQLMDLAAFFEGRRADPAALEEWMAPAFSFAKQHGASLYCGEFGVLSTAPGASRCAWLRDTIEIFAQHQVSWSLWSYKGMGFGLVGEDGEILDTRVLDAVRQQPD